MSGPGHIAHNDNDLPTLSRYHTDIIEYIELRLGGGMVDVELDRAHYNMAIKQALLRYRQRAARAVEESYAFLDLVKDTQEYILPKEIEAVKAIYRRGLGGMTGGSQFEPFSSGYLNTYMLAAGKVGGLASYELFVDYQKLTMVMFGGYITYTYNEATKKLVITRKVATDVETVMLHIYNHKPDQVILADSKAFPWIQEYAYSMAKYSLGEAREKFATIAGPQGGTSLNGAALKTEAKAEMDSLMDDLNKYADSSEPLTWIVG